MAKTMFAYDQLDVLTFVQDDSSATVDAYDASVDNVTTSGKITDVLDFEAASPDFQALSLYVRPLKDVNGAGISGTGSPKIVATLLSSATETASPATSHTVATQISATEVLELPIPASILRYVGVKVASDGGGSSNAINTGAIQVFIGPSRQLGS